MEAVQRAAGVVRSETAADVQGVTERLEAAERQKLSLLQVNLTPTLTPTLTLPLPLQQVDLTPFLTPTLTSTPAPTPTLD